MRDSPECALSRSRLVLACHPVTADQVTRLLAALPIAGSPAVSFLPVLGQAVTMLTGGIRLEADPAMAGGTWELSADGVTLAQGTVVCVAGLSTLPLHSPGSWPLACCAPALAGP